jgi:hypothetical protein
MRRLLFTVYAATLVVFLGCSLPTDNAESSTIDSSSSNTDETEESVDLTPVDLNALAATLAGFDDEKALAPTVIVSKSGDSWVVTDNGIVNSVSYSDMFDAVNAAIGCLTTGRSTKEKVLIENSGESGNRTDTASVKSINLTSYTILDFSGNTIDCNAVDSSGTADDYIVPILGSKASNISIRNLVVTGNPRYGIWLKSCEDMVLDNITMNLDCEDSNVGIGIRVDYSANSTHPFSKNLYADDITITGAGDNAFETYGLDGFYIGTVTASDCDCCGLLLNYSKNGIVGTVDATRCSYNNQTSGIYAAFRTANDNGPNVHVHQVTSVNCGRGFFSCTDSNGCVIDNVNITDSLAQGILIQNAQYVYVLGGTVSDTDGADKDGVRFLYSASTNSTLATKHNTVKNLTVSGFKRGVYESESCDYNHILNNTFSANTISLSVSGSHTEVSGNSGS